MEHEKAQKVAEESLQLQKDLTLALEDKIREKEKEFQLAEEKYNEIKKQVRHN